MVDTDSKTSDLDKLDSRVRQALDAGAEFDQDTMDRLHAMRSAAVARARADAVEAAIQPAKAMDLEQSWDRFGALMSSMEARA